MKKIILLSIISSFIFSQEGEITNVMASQRTDGSKIIDIYYDLSEDATSPSFNISVEVSFDGGLTYLPITNATGDTGENIIAGESLYIEWDIGVDYDNNFSDTTKIKVTATGNVIIDVPFEMVEVPAGEYNGFDYNYHWEEDEGNTTMNIDYTFEIMKYPVTNSQFAEFLITLYNDGLIDDGSFPTAYYPGDQFTSNTQQWVGDLNTGYCSGEENNNGEINWNGTTYVVTEGRGNHPVAGVTWYGAAAFAYYYGLRLPAVQELIKTGRGTEEWNFPYEQLGTNMNPLKSNFEGSNDPFECGTTPVDFYNGQTYEGFLTIDSPSFYGAYINGNVSEWTNNFSYELYGGTPGNIRIRNSHSFHQDGFNEHRINRVQGATPGGTSGTTGFRCARTIAQ